MDRNHCGQRAVREDHADFDLALLRGWSPHDLHALPTPILEQMLQATNEILALVPHTRGVVEDTIAEQEAAARKLKKAFKDAAKSASEEVAALHSAAFSAGESITVQGSQINSILSTSLGNVVTPTILAETEQHLRAIWATSKQLAASEASVAYSFALFDSGAAATLNGHQVFWVNNLYSKELSNRIQEVAREVLVKSGLDAADKGAFLEQSLKRELGVITGGKTDLAKVVPSRYAGNPGRYIDNVVHTAAHQARMFSTVQAFREAQGARGGKIGYVWDNPNDRRTGPQCRKMSGQYFEVDDGVKVMERVLNADTPEQVKAISPWMNIDQLNTVLGDAEIGTDAARQRLVASGVAMPPLHGA